MRHGSDVAVSINDEIDGATWETGGWISQNAAENFHPSATSISRTIAETLGAQEVDAGGKVQQ